MVLENVIGDPNGPPLGQCDHQWSSTFACQAVGVALTPQAYPVRLAEHTEWPTRHCVDADAHPVIFYYVDNVIVHSTCLYFELGASLLAHTFLLQPMAVELMQVARFDQPEDASYGLALTLRGGGKKKQKIREADRELLEQVLNQLRRYNAVDDAETKKIIRLCRIDDGQPLFTSQQVANMFYRTVR